MTVAPGAFIAIGGASGVGKDTLIRYARERLVDDRVLFVQRTITRPAGDAAEAHVGVSEARFAELSAGGAFALSWSAHGLHYGLPIACDAAIHAGKIVVANISRTILPMLEARYARVVPVLVTADRATLVDRLRARGREAEDEIARRAGRAIDPDGRWTVIANDGPVSEAGDKLLALLKSLLADSEPA